ncbi:MAG: proteasome assembly chaperone family protein [Candidatus Micrarchaeaceae archaeon]|jgi:uncharacterized protein
MITKTVIKRKKGIKANKSILVVGLPGIGNVGKLIAEHLKKELNAEKIATLYSPHFPHQVIMLKNGKIRLVNNRFYIIKAKKPNTNDIILLTGDAQALSSEGQYEVNAKIVDFFKQELDGQFIYTIGGYNIGENMATKPRVFANATSSEVIKQFKGSDVIFGKSKGVIFGSAGLIIAFAKMQKIDGVCLMGETGFLEVDASAAKAVLLQLSKRLNIKTNTTNLDKIIEKTAKAVKELEAQMGGSMGQPMPYPIGGKAEKDAPHPSYIR